MRLERSGEIAVLHLEAGKVNAINDAFLSALGGLLDGLGDAKAAVITAAGSTFSAGLDLPSLIELDRAGVGAFIERFGEVMLRLFELPIPLVAAINGHAIAGGCVLALQADVRVMSQGRIGLNEAQLGLGLPAVILETLRAQVPASSLVPIALEGRLFAPDEALRLGLIDAVESDPLAAALVRARALALPAAGTIKRDLRSPVAARIRAVTDSARWAETWFAPGTHERLREAVARLTRKPAAAAP